jgi:hypothetical protein
MISVAADGSSEQEDEMDSGHEEHYAATGGSSSLSIPSSRPKRTSRDTHINYLEPSTDDEDAEDKQYEEEEEDDDIEAEVSDEY